MNCHFDGGGGDAGGDSSLSYLPAVVGADAADRQAPQPHYNRAFELIGVVGAAGPGDTARLAGGH